MPTINVPPSSGGIAPTIDTPTNSGGSSGSGGVSVPSYVGPEGPQGPQGEPGTDGVNGANGTNGTNGVGVPAGGSTGQVLGKTSGADYATAWIEQTGGGGGSSPPFPISDITGLSDALTAKAPTVSPTFTGTVSGVTAAMVGLGSVTNTSDADKPVSSAQLTALNLKAPLASPTFTGTVSGITSAMVGLGNVTNTSDANKPVSTAQQTALDLKAPIASPTFTGTVSGVSKAMVGLGSVDNTADTAKPVSTAQQTALNLKANLASPTFTGTVVLPAGQVVNGVTLTTGGGTSNFLRADGTYAAPPGGGGAAWGSITGTLSSQTDLNTALGLKANSASPTFTGTVTLPAGQTVNGVTLSAAQGTSNFLRGDGTYAAPAGGGGSSDPLDLATEYSSTEPSAPATGVRVFARAKGRRRPAWVGPSGHSASVQSLLGANKCRFWTAQGNASTVTAINMTGIATGTATVRNVLATSVFESVPRIGYVQATAGASAVTGIRHNVLQFFRGNPDGTAGPGGFELIHRFGITAITSGGKGFMGMVNTASGVAGTAVPSAFLNCVGVGFDAADTNFSAYINDGSGSATKTDLGSGFPAKTVNDDFYESRIFIAPRGTEAYVSLENLKTGAFAEVVFTTNLPAIGTLLAEQIWLSSGADVAAPGIDVSSRYIETDL